MSETNADNHIERTTEHATDPAAPAAPPQPVPLPAPRPEPEESEAMSPEPSPEPSARQAQTALFRAHATARLRGETAEALGLALQIGEAQRMSHMVFLIALFTQAVYEEFGARPDPEDLAALTRRLHEKHYAANPGFNALRSEALVRAVCGESFWFNEVPLAEQPGYMWAVMGELVPSDSTDTQLAERFALADDTRAEVFQEVRGTAEAHLPPGTTANPANPHSQDDTTSREETEA
jgi:hypothetical protein